MAATCILILSVLQYFDFNRRHTSTLTVGYSGGGGALVPSNLLTLYHSTPLYTENTHEWFFSVKYSKNLLAADPW